ncbi:PP2C family serine/threonine-protein phosphatase [Vibrio cholerae]
MLNVFYQQSFCGDRDENLDRYGHIRGDGWSLSYVFDGFEIADPHYVDRLQLEVKKLGLEQGALTVSDVLGKLSDLVSIDNPPDGKASVVFVVSSGEQVSVLYAGDTRAYFLSSKERTSDHSVAQKMINEGKSQSDTLPRHPLRRYLTNKLHGSNGFNALERVDFHGGQEIILCSDGVWSCIASDSDFYSLAMSGGERVYNEALSRRPINRDNMTILHLKP